jgi:hypothetical protein
VLYYGEGLSFSQGSQFQSEASNNQLPEKGTRLNERTLRKMKKIILTLKLRTK